MMIVVRYKPITEGKNPDAATPMLVKPSEIKASFCSLINNKT